MKKPCIHGLDDHGYTIDKCFLWVLSKSDSEI